MSDEKGVIELIDDGIKQTNELIDNFRKCNDQNHLPQDILDLLNHLEQNVKKVENIKKSIQTEKTCSNDTRADKQNTS